MSACLTLALAVISAKAVEPKRVLIVHSFGSAAPPFTTHSSAFETELTDKMGEKVDLDEVSLDMARYADLDMQEALVEYLIKRRSKWQPDLVVPVGSPAGIFVAQNHERIFPDTPVIYCGLDRRRLPVEALQKNAAFVGEDFDLPGFVEDMLQLAPATTNIAMVIGASPLEKFWAEAFRKEYESYTNRVQFTWFADLSFDQMLERSRTLPPRSFIFVVLLLRDATGVTHNADEALQRLRAVANAPINGIFQHQLGLGIVGGRLYQAEQEGVEAAHLAVRILNGQAPSSFPPIIVPPLAPRYDSRELQRWNIGHNRLPPGSTVLFREPTAWERYRAWVFAGLAVFVAQALLIGAFLANFFKRRRAEKSLAVSEARFRVAADAAPMLMWMSGTDSLRTFFNRPWLRFTGRAMEQELGNGWEEGIHPDDRDRRCKTYAEAFDARKPFALEFRLRRHDGQWRWVTDDGVPRYGPDNEFIGYIGSCLDVTERREKELEVQRQRQELAHSSRVLIMGELSASMAHELNQPLTAILANAQAGQRFLAQPLPDLGEFREILKDIASDTTRARDVIRNLRAFVKKEATEFSRLDLNEILQQVVRFLHGDIVSRNGRVELQLSSDLPAINGDRVQLQQVAVNLIINAFDAMSELPAGERRVTLTTNRETSEYVRLIVRDSGPGIAPGDLEKIFQPFYTGKSDGLGMGLAITRTIVELHGGRIWAENPAGGGAALQVTLPVANRAQEFEER